MPNTPNSGKGLKADAARDDNIKEAVDEVKNKLLTYTGIVNEKAHAIIDPDTMYSTNRPVTFEFIEILSHEKHPNEEPRSLFAKGYMFRRRGVPELVKIMHRSNFLDMSSKLSAASRGNLGEEMDRKHWHNGRQMYKTLLKYMFEGMGLTPSARVLKQHVTAWDPEFAVARVEANAAEGQRHAHYVVCGNGVDNL